MSLSYLLAQYGLREEMEKFVRKSSTSLLKRLRLQPALTWQKEYIEKELRGRTFESENLTAASPYANGITSDQLSTILATQTWY